MKRRAPLRETVRISAEVLDEYRYLASEEGRTLSGLLDLILRAELEYRRKKDGYKASAER